MKVSIVTEGFYKTGYGHITRCLALYQAFDIRNINVMMYINGDDSSISVLGEAPHEIIDWLSNPELLFSRIDNSDIVIVDSYLAQNDFYERISALTSFPVFLDDNQRLNYPRGIILNGAVYSKLFNYPQDKDLPNFLGLKYVPLRKAFWNVAEKKLNSDPESVMITFGGQDLQNLTPAILQSIVRNYPNIKKNVVVGSGFVNVPLIEEAKDSNTEIFYSPEAAEMLRLMLDSDIVISAAGQTLYELARTGTPTIAICVAENQLNNLLGWIKEGFISSDIRIEDSNLEQKVLLSMSTLSGIAERKNISTISRSKVDGQGAKLVIQSLIDLASSSSRFYFRNTCASDAKMVFNLSNDRIVRLNSINQNPISWEEHIFWFNKIIADDNSLLLLAFTKSDAFIGQVRFDINNNTAKVGISIDKEFRGKGFSKPMIINAGIILLKKFPEVNSILAYIRPQNSPSIQTFAKAGYNFFGEEIVGEENYLLYKMERK